MPYIKYTYGKQLLRKNTKSIHISHFSKEWEKLHARTSKRPREREYRAAREDGEGLHRTTAGTGLWNLLGGSRERNEKDRRSLWPRSETRLLGLVPNWDRGDGESYARHRSTLGGSLYIISRLTVHIPNPVMAASVAAGVSVLDRIIRGGGTDRRYRPPESPITIIGIIFLHALINHNMKMIY